VEPRAGRVRREEQLAELGVGAGLRGGVGVVGDEAAARAEEPLLVARRAREPAQRAQRRDVVAAKAERRLHGEERVVAGSARQREGDLRGEEGAEDLAPRGGALREGREGAGGAVLLAAPEPHRGLGGEGGRESGAAREPLRGQVERLLVEAVLEGEEREEPLGREGVRGRRRARREPGLARPGEVAAGGQRLRLAERPRPLVGGEEIGGGGGGRGPRRVAVPRDTGDAARDLDPRDAHLARARQLPGAPGEHAAQERREGLGRQALLADGLDDRPRHVRERRRRQRGRPEDPRRVEHERDALLAVRQEPRGEREGRPAGEPPRDLEEALARREPHLLETERGEPRLGERRLGEGGLRHDRHLDEVGEAVAELARALADVEGERDVGDLEREGLEAEAGEDGLVREAHRGPAALEAQLEARPAPRRDGGGRGGGRVLAPRHPGGILPSDRHLREVREARDGAIRARPGARRPRSSPHPPARCRSPGEVARRWRERSAGRRGRRARRRPRAVSRACAGALQGAGQRRMHLFPRRCAGGVCAETRRPWPE
jgi:hypothetical protein